MVVSFVLGVGNVTIFLGSSRCKVGESSLESMIREAMAKAFSTGESEAKDKLITAKNADSALLQEAKDLLQLVV